MMIDLRCLQAIVPSNLRIKKRQHIISFVRLALAPVVLKGVELHGAGVRCKGLPACHGSGGLHVDQTG